MALILAIETSGSYCSVSLAEDGVERYGAVSFLSQSHSQLLGLLIEKALEVTGFNWTEVHAIAIGSGPGSYTGLRIAASVAKGICFGLQKPLIGISTQENLAYQALQAYPSAALISVALDARRNEVYAAALNPDFSYQIAMQALVLDESELQLAGLVTHSQVVWVGDGAEKVCSFFHNPPNWHLDSSFYPNALSVAGLAAKKFENQQFEDIATFEPDYMKPVFITRPK